MTLTCDVPRLVFVYPLTALINLFMYVIQNPQHPTVDSDIRLMYLVAGHFSYLEFATFDRSFPFVWHTPNLARLAVSRMKERSSNNAQDGPQLDGSNPGEAQMGLNPINLDTVSYIARCFVLQLAIQCQY